MFAWSRCGGRKRLVNVDIEHPSLLSSLLLQREADAGWVRAREQRESVVCVGRQKRGNGKKGLLDGKPGAFQVFFFCVDVSSLVSLLDAEYR